MLYILTGPDPGITSIKPNGIKISNVKMCSHKATCTAFGLRLGVIFGTSGMAENDSAALDTIRETVVSRLLGGTDFKL